MQTQIGNTNRMAVTSMETLVAIIVLSIAAMAVSQFVVTVHSGLQDQELSQRIGWEIENARELIGSWPVEKITQERIEQLPFANGLSENLVQARWVARVKQVEEPMPATRVTLGIECQYQGQVAMPQEMTFWIPAEIASE